MTCTCYSLYYEIRKKQSRDNITNKHNEDIRSPADADQPGSAYGSERGEGLIQTQITVALQNIAYWMLIKSNASTHKES